MNARGSLYVPIVCGIMIIMLIVAYFGVEGYYAQHSKLDITDNIGSKQAAIMTAVRQGERVELYIEQAAHLLRKQTQVDVTCGEYYLGMRMLGRGSCQSASIITGYPQLHRMLAQYPEMTLTDIDWQLLESDATTKTQTIVGTKRIPIGRFEIPAGTVSGFFVGWPTDYKEISSAGSLFGKREVIRNVDSTNHPGLDITTHNKTGENIYSLTSGNAVFIESGENSFVRVANSDLIIEYLHVRPAETVQNAIRFQENPVPVNPGDIIAVSGPHGNTPHLHLQVYITSVTKMQVEMLWPDKVGNRFADLKETYAVITSQEDRVLLNPACFFDRGTIEDVLTEGVPADSLFIGCEAYSTDLGIDKKLSELRAETPTVTEEQLESAGPQATSETPITPNEQNKFKATQQKIIEQELAPDITAAANDEQVSSELLLAIISQESQGDSLAVSQTGCAGIAQFCYGTANNTAFKDIFTKLTPCNCEGSACRNPSTRACTESNDDRFDPEKSVQAQARLVKDNLQSFEGHDQKLAFAIGAYNGGASVIKKAIAATSKGTGASWPDVRAALQTLPVSDFTPPTEQKREEVITYVDTVLRFYEMWGGTDFAGSIYTGKQFGYYDLKLVMADLPPSSFEAPIRMLHEKISACADRTCVSAAIAAANTASISITPELLSGDDGCLERPLAAALDFANQVAWCKASPDTDCSCPVRLEADAVYKVTPASVEVARYKGELVTTPLYDGLNTETLGEGGQKATVSYVPAEGAAMDRDTLYAYRGRIAYALGETVPSVFNDNYPFVSLGKQAGSLVFEQQSSQACSLPPLPQAYCIRDRNDQNKKAVFFVDMKAAPAENNPQTPS